MGGSYYVNNATAPAYWDHYATWPNYCGENDFYAQNGLGWEYHVGSVYTQNLSTFAWVCTVQQIEGASTRFAVQGQTPSSLTLDAPSPGATFSTTYGMPILYVYDGFNSPLATETASSVGANGASATFPFPSSLSEGAYSVAAVNKISATQYAATAVNLLSIAQTKNYSGSPFGVAVAGQTDAYSYRDTCHRIYNSGSDYFTVPIITLFTGGEILVDGEIVAVGTNPT